MNWMNKYEKRAFLFLFGGFIWSIMWMFATWSYLHWFDVIYENKIMLIVGVILLTGYIWFMINMIVNLVIGQWKTFSHSKSSGSEVNEIRSSS